MNTTPNNQSDNIHLHEFLRNEQEAILTEWEHFDRHQIESAQALTSEELRNSVPVILNSLADNAEKAEAGAREISIPREGPEEHAHHRWQMGFCLEEVTREYGLLRTVVLKKLTSHPCRLHYGENALILLNEALDDAIIQSVITFVEQTNKALQAEREHLEVTLQNISDAVISTDMNGRILHFNRAAERITGWSRRKVSGVPLDRVLITDYEASAQTLNSLNQQYQLPAHTTEKQLKRRNGEILPVEETSALLRNARGDCIGKVTTLRDMSTIRALTTELSFQASHDPLTELPNRMMLHEELGKALASAERHNSRLALLYLDLDLFKDVNDMLGHSVGDELLRQVARRLEHGVRQTDTVSRMGGDEFVILLVDFEPVSYLGELSRKLAQQLQVPFVLGDNTVELSTSVGVSVFPEDGRDAETLIKHADIAMYEAKARGRNNVQFFSPEMNRRAAERHYMEADLRNAIANHQLAVHFQPQIALGSGELIGAEVLLRWHHPTLGLISPSRFIPVAERSGTLMMSIGDWVLQQACQQARTWVTSSRKPLRLSVNVSVAQLRHDHFLAHVAEQLKRFDLPPDMLQLEITESIVMSDFNGSKDHLQAFKDLGVGIAVDDFGTGYSSLSYLKDLPVDEVKIDQSFVHDIGANPDKAGIVQAVIRMGESLNLRVVAEGVEDQAAADFLASNNCEGAQGFYYGRPITPAAFEYRFLGGTG